MSQKTLWHYWPLYCLAVLTGFVIAFGINPSDRFDWALENILTVIWLAIILWSYKHFRLSNISYTLITVFMMLHTIGSHYTYAEVPFGFWLQDMMGFARNHYDRIVHFSFGLLLAYPIREVFMRIAMARGFWGYYLPIDLTLSFSAVYEVIEWLVAVTLAPSQGSAFLGTQGDEWDAIKDMALAGTGALINMVITAIIDAKMNPKFWDEIKDSFRVKNKTPLGEVTILRRLNKRR